MKTKRKIERKIHENERKNHGKTKEQPLVAVFGQLHFLKNTMAKKVQTRKLLPGISFSWYSF